MNIDLDLMRKDALAIVQKDIFVVNTHLSWAQFYDSVTALCNQFLIAAAASLLVDRKSDMFFLNCCRSAENWRRLMLIAQRDYQQDMTLHVQRPLLAGLVAQDMALMRNILAVLPAECQTGKEYPVPFHTLWLFYLLSESKMHATPTIESHLMQLQSHEKQPDDSELFKALLQRDGRNEADFWGLFADKVHQREAYVERKVNNITTSITEFASERYIWFEGLVWLRLAALAGYTRTDGSDFPYCPSEALLTMSTPYPNDWIIMARTAL